MVLSDSEIKIRVTKDKLLELHDPGKIKYCGYELTLGSVVEPKTGDLVSLTGGPKGWVRGVRNWIAGSSNAARCFVLEPADTMIIVTREVLNMPKDLCATYGQLNRLANHGLMILNTSVVEPGYSGPLSCVLVNFSSQRLSLVPGESIAKLNFHTLQGLPDSFYPGKFDHDTYEQLASQNATCLPRSLLDISGVEERVTQKVNSRVTRSITTGSIIIALLLLWSQMEGFLSNWIYNHTGMMSTTKQVEMLMEKQAIQQQKETQELHREINDLQEELKSLKTPRGVPHAGNR
jgi:deoxycytidine triphosphate deaminase